MTSDVDQAGSGGAGAGAPDPLLDGWNRWHVLVLTAAGVLVLDVVAFVSMVSRSRDPNAGWGYLLCLLSMPGAAAGVLASALVLRFAWPSRRAAGIVTAALMILGIAVNLELLGWPVSLLWRS